MNIYWASKQSEGDTELQLEAMRKYVKLTGLESADVIFCGSIDAMDVTRLAMETKKPLAVYCWDYYSWAHQGKHPGVWNWTEYAELLKQADIVFVPSNAQKRTLKELLNVDSIVVRSGIKHLNLPVLDEGFILDPVRYYPDPNRTWAEEAAKELGIPIIHSEHQYSQKEFQRLVSTCTFLTCCYREASTGGLTLMEGAWLGKPSLVSDSPYMGARDYLGDYGNYFHADDFNDLKKQMWILWSLRPKVHARVYMKKFLTFDTMAKGIYENLRRITATV